MGLDTKRLIFLYIIDDQLVNIHGMGFPPAFSPVTKRGKRLVTTRHINNIGFEQDMKPTPSMGGAAFD